jgi:UDP-GlcNAc3NAcA epimerase
MTKVVTIVGARPQFVKAAVVSGALARAGVDEVLVHTGQHFDAAMSDVFFQELGLATPRHHLGIGGLGHAAMTGRMLEAIERVLTEERPAWVLVYGDTNSTLAGALAASKLHIPVAHVEAGMRPFNRRMPEEINRVLTDHVSDLLLVTGEAPVRLLAAEGITRGVHVVGDVMLEAQRLFAAASARSGARARLAGTAPYALLTLHRAENTDDPERLRAIFAGLSRVAGRLTLILPLHPRTRGLADRYAVSLESFRLLEPVGYLEMQDLEAGAALILTDSGGVQKEAFFHGVPCVTLRDETEWTETFDLGWNVLAGPDPARIEAAATAFSEASAPARRHLSTAMATPATASQPSSRGLAEAPLLRRPRAVRVGDGRTATRTVGDRRQGHVAGSCLLHPGAHWTGPPAHPRDQAPDHGRGCRSRGPKHHRICRPAHHVARPLSPLPQL